MKGNSKSGNRRMMIAKFEELVEGYQVQAQSLKEREERLASELSTLRAKLLSEDGVRRALTDFHRTFASLPVENRVNLCKLFFRRIEVRYVPTGEVAGASGGYALQDGTIVFPHEQKRTQWIEMKFQVQANVDYHRI